MKGGGHNLLHDPDVEGIVLNFRDITGRKQADEALRRAEEQLHHVLVSTTALIYAMKIEGEWVVPTWVSENIVQIIGWEAGETLREQDWWITHVHPDDRSRVLGNVSALLQQSHLVVEYRLQHKNGTYRWVRDELRLMRDPAGQPVEIIGSWVDITEQRRVAETLRQTEKLAEMGSLLAGVAHELNNPLAVVMGQAALLRRSVKEGPLTQRAEKIAQAAERCARIIRNFLALARQRPPERSVVRLNQVVEEAVELLAYSLRVDNVEVRLELAEGLPVLWGDPNQLHQVVVNLITNAHQAMRETPPPRRLTLTTRHDLATHRVSLEVTDSGPGIPAELQGRIFEPFFTTKPPGQGTGLGLSLCQGIVEGHGGTIRVESAPERGAAFVIELPVTAPPESKQEAAIAEAVPQVQGKRILVVDDEPEVAGVLAEMLAVAGHRVDTVGNGALALHRIEQQPYDLIISDLRMPELDGPGLYRELARRHPDLRRRIIFLTGDTLGPETMEFLERTGAPNLGKPFSLDEVQRVLQRALEAP